MFFCISIHSSSIIFFWSSFLSIPFYSFVSLLGSKTSPNEHFWVQSFAQKNTQFGFQVVILHKNVENGQTYLYLLFIHQSVRSKMILDRLEISKAMPFFFLCFSQFWSHQEFLYIYILDCSGRLVGITMNQWYAILLFAGDWKLHRPIHIGTVRWHPPGKPIVIFVILKSRVCHLKVRGVDAILPWISTSSTAQGGGGSFKNRKRIGEIDCCAWRMSKQKHWPTD